MNYAIDSKTEVMSNWSITSIIIPCIQALDWFQFVVLFKPWLETNQETGPEWRDLVACCGNSNVAQRHVSHMMMRMMMMLMMIQTCIKMRNRSNYFWCVTSWWSTRDKETICILCKNLSIDTILSELIEKGPVSTYVCVVDWLSSGESTAWVWESLAHVSLLRLLHSVWIVLHSQSVHWCHHWKLQYAKEKDMYTLVSKEVLSRSLIVLYLLFQL